jgi:hypothetical protein
MASLDGIIFADSYDELSVTNVQENERLLSALWSSAEPEIDVQRGALAALVVRPAATLLEVGKQAFVRAMNNSNLNSLLADASERSRELLDAFAANYHVTRKIGAVASGKIRVIFAVNEYRTIGLTTQFLANGMIFMTDRVQQVNPTGSPEFTDAHIFREMQDGSGYVFFDIPVTATSNGSAGNLVRGAELTMDDPLPGFVRAIALDTFTGGEDDETNESLVQRMMLGLSAKVLSSRINMKAALLDAFPNIRDSSVIGAGDTELTRDKHSVFPGSTGGYVDWYVGTTRQLVTKECILEGDQIQTLLVTNGGLNHCIRLDNSQIPCIYRVLSVQEEETLEYYAITDQTLTTDRDDSPRVYDNQEDVFTGYHLTTVWFRSLAPDKEAKRVRVTALCMPDIKEIQDWVLQPAQAPVGADILVKAAIPTQIRFSAILNTPASEVVDYIALQNIIANYINYLPFDGLLTISGLIALLHRNLPAGSFVTSPALFGQTILPSGETVYSQTEDKLVINFPPYATNRTTLFYCNPTDVSFEHRYT